MDQTEAGVDCTLRVIFMRLWKTKVGEYPVTHVSGDIPFVPFYGLLAGVLIRAIDFA